MPELHFDNIASSYDEQLPSHIREFLLVKKTRLTVETLKKYGIINGRGIDLGCGTGWYLKSLLNYGYNLFGLDSSPRLIQEARLNNKDKGIFLAGDILSLSLADNSFDFAYCINSLHHLKDKLEIYNALREIRRILRKGGILVIHELNTFFLFRIYLNYIFPLTNKIDKFGGENWIAPKDLLKQDLFMIREIYFYTFFPHIIPKLLFPLFCKVNSFLENISLRKFGVHYMAVLEK